MHIRSRLLIGLLGLHTSLAASLACAQSPEPPHDATDAGIATVPPEAAPTAKAEGPDAAVSAEAAPEPPRGDQPVSAESLAHGAPSSVAPSSAPSPPPAREPAPPSGGRERAAHPPRRAESDAQPQEPLVVWASGGLASAFGPARCGPDGLEGTDLAIRIASALARSLETAGIGIAVSGALADHPLLAYAAREQPEQLADLLKAAGFSALVLGVVDLAGPLLREPELTRALRKRGITVIASNLECGGQDFCEAWATAEDPLPILESRGRRYAVFSAFPDDLGSRVEAAAGRQFGLRSAGQTLLDRTRQARAQGADVALAIVDHGPDSGASSELAQLLGDLPAAERPELLLSPSAADALLFMRPLDVQPAVVGTRRGVLTGVRVTKLPDTHDADVFARSVRLYDWSPALADKVQALGQGYCRAQQQPLKGATLNAAMSHDDFLDFAARATRAVAGADLAVIDPLAYDPNFATTRATTLSRGQAERTVVFDAPIVRASVTLDWIAALTKRLDGLRPLVLIGNEPDQGTPLIGGRTPVPGARYSIATTSVLARSGRLPDGATWVPVDEEGATLRGALIAQLDIPDPGDPRMRVPEPADSTQWILRTDGQAQASLTAVTNPGTSYDDPGLLVNESRQLGAQLLLNFDGDAPKFLFENRLQAGFDRNFATHTTAQDLLQVETTYTYRGLWPTPLLYPHPFVEGYLETQFVRGNARYQPLLLRPEAGVRSMLSRVTSFKLSVGFEYRAFDPERQIYPGVGAELVIKPTTIALSNGVIQLEGGISYFWNSPGNIDQHALRGQLIGAMTVLGPLQFTLTTLGTLRKDPGHAFGKGFSTLIGLRVRLVDRSLTP